MTFPTWRGARMAGWPGGCGPGTGCGNPRRPSTGPATSEIVALLRACRSARDRLIVLVMARAGLRRGELCGLRRGDVHLLADSRGWGARSPARICTWCAATTTRTGRGRSRAGSGWCRWTSWSCRRSTATSSSGCGSPAAAGSDFVFVNLFRAPIGAPLRPDAVGELLAAASRRAGLDRAVRPHQLRHAFASNVADAGGGIDVVADLLGHASVVLLAGVCPSRPTPRPRRPEGGGRSARCSPRWPATPHSRSATRKPRRPRTCGSWRCSGWRGGWFTTISQPWLRQAAKRWATDELPRRRGDGAASVLRSLLAGVVRLSQSLRGSRPDHGDHPALLGRGDIESFLHRMSYLVATGECSPELRAKTCRDVKRILARIRALGADPPRRPRRRAGRRLHPRLRRHPRRARTRRTRPRPACVDHGAAVWRVPVSERGPSGREIRVAVELLMDTGRRPAEILRLPLDCLTRDPDGAAVLIYDNHKRDRRERRLPISQATAAVITAQQRRVRERFPDTPLAQLALLPSPHANPTGAKSLSGGLLDLRHRDWVDQLPVLRRADGTEFDRTKIVPYAYRHTYAQRHADAGIAVDVLSQLLDHRTLEVTRRYYNPRELHQTGENPQVGCSAGSRSGRRSRRLERSDLAI